ncbi:MAG: hypothetical protein V6Z86_05465 [Hyphomicrobiales bacterium]
MRSNLLDLTVIAVHTTDRAILVKDAEDAEGVWLPLSAIEVDLASDGRTATITIPEALAQEKGLI